MKNIKETVAVLLIGGAIICFWFVVMFALFFTAMGMFKEKDPMGNYMHSKQAWSDSLQENRDELYNISKEATRDVLKEFNFTFDEPVEE